MIKVRAQLLRFTGFCFWFILWLRQTSQNNLMMIMLMMTMTTTTIILIIITCVDIFCWPYSIHFLSSVTIPCLGL